MEYTMHKSFMNYNSLATSEYDRQDNPAFRGIQGVTGMLGNQGIQGCIGNQGIQGRIGNQGIQGGITADGNCGYMSASIPEDRIENAVLEILKKHNVYIPTSTEVSIGYINDDNQKTFTLDEVIKIIESMDTRLNVNVHGIWENSSEHLIDKDKLIEKFKSC